MFPRFHMTILTASLLVATSLPARAERLDKAGLAGHKALYNIEMTSRRSSSQVLNIHGQMYFALQPGCDAWTTDHRFNLYYEYADSPPMQITSAFTTYEPLDGQSFHFNSRRKRDGEAYQELRGAAQQDEKGHSHVTYTLPEGLAFDMAPGGLFPMAHTAAMMDAVKAGHKVFNAVVFDGSDENGPIEVNAIMGKAAPPVAIPAGGAIESGLLSAPARFVRMAFFPLEDDNPAPDYEMDVVLHDNGIISRMNVDYGEFSVSQNLVALQDIKAPACDKQMSAKPDKKATPVPVDMPHEKPRRKLFGLIP